MEAMECLLTRRSVRAYTRQPVPRALLERIMEAALYAPSARGEQSASYAVVTDRDTLALLSQMNARVMGTDTDPYYGASAVILAFARPGSCTSLEDATLGLGNIMNAAHALGLAACWIHREKEMFDTQEGKALLARWGFTQPVEGVGACIVGYAKEALPKPRARRGGNVFYVE